MDLIKKQIHMNRWKGDVTTQVTLDDDFIVPDTMDDMEQVMLKTGEIQVEAVKNQGEKVAVKGKLDFQVLYRKEGGGLQTLGGSIPFDEIINAPGLDEKDYTGLNWYLEDLSADMINSRKLGVKAIVTLDLRVEALRDVEAAVDVDMEEQEQGAASEAWKGSLQVGSGKTADAGGGSQVQVETLKQTADVAAIAVRRKDTYRIKDELTLSGNKPNIEQLLWREMRLRGVNVRPLDGRLHLEGELMVFIIYSGEGENTPVQWLEESIPFAGEVELPEAVEEMVPMVTVRLAHKDVEAKPDYDGELRELDVDAVLELDIKLYEEQKVELLKDMYSTNREVKLQTNEACFDQILTKNICKSKISEKLELEYGERILQICHSEGEVKLDDVEIGEDNLKVDGVLEVTILYLTSDDASPIQSTVKQVPFQAVIEARGIRGDSAYQLNPGLEQLTAVMVGGDMVEVKGVVTLEALVLQQVCQPVITDVSIEPMDVQRLQQLPGIVGYIVQPEDTLWDVARKFHTTIDNIMSTNELVDDQVKPGVRLILVKEIAQG